MVDGLVRGNPRWPLSLVARPCQPPQPYGVRTVKKLSGISWSAKETCFTISTNSFTPSRDMCLCKGLLGALLTPFLQLPRLRGLSENVEWISETYTLHSRVVQSGIKLLRKSLEIVRIFLFLKNFDSYQRLLSLLANLLNRVYYL